MKKGEITLESLILFIVTFSLSVVLISILGSFIYSAFFAKEKSVDEQDFNRIVEELKSMLERQKDTDCIRVPVRSGSALMVSVNPKGSLAAPAGCAGDACLCHTPVKEGSTGKLNCVRFTKIVDCSQTNACFKLSKTLLMNEGDTVVTIIKDVAGIELEPNAPCDVQP